MGEIESRVRGELSEVLDPCSVSTERPVDIVALGLVEDVEVDDSVARVELLLTSQECTFFMNMREEIEDRLVEIPGIDDVVVTQERNKLWTPDRMAEPERQARREHFRQQIEAHDIEPYYTADSD